ncbi:glucose-1-phosphate thymidylyltransferase RfbA [Micromonospora sp. DR5-3]|uniref:glucose-1-phosphate thymidylyltransferase RfbA n=1 Tax=unclassified Micromonospora TaxID=2617518 RepID=UPI0011D46F21|nr:MULTISPECIES: glucose-1-phosphate thymidylyltransferase RfbA [unclassified Micromonospora]MCW3818283.1 glucose-1-phosphate thymidylyltransferase RfbA [Micromonospora sp. DR5-3]TYC21188.1 glucose-1-phosphate thymidylyltransferase RfbA [Micromonospora sp. MP36]
MKGIVLAGGTGTRLYPLTLATSKQLLPVYDKPMLYYPLSVLMLAGIRDILIISNPDVVPHMRHLLGDGSRLGLNVSYAEQKEPRGIAEAFLIGAGHIGHDRSALILGDNLFHGAGFYNLLQREAHSVEGCTLFGYSVSDPERYGIAETDADGRLISISEKPRRPRSNQAITGLYFYDNDVVSIAAGLSPSDRGELEITDVNQEYLRQRRAGLVPLSRGYTWMDCGTHASLLAASQYVQVIQERQGVRVACLEEIALRMGFIDAETCYELGAGMRQSDYGRYLTEIAYALD